MVAYPFEGRLAHQTLGMLLTRRLERAGARPLGFVATDYSLAVWALATWARCSSAASRRSPTLFDEDMLGDDLEAWLAESWLLKRTFRNCAVISGLIEQRHPGKEKSGRQVTVSTDLDLRRAAQPRARPHPAAGDARRCGDRPARCQRLGEMLSRIKGRIVHKDLDHISPLAVPIMLEIGKEPVYGEAQTTSLAEAADALIREAMGEEPALEPAARRTRRDAAARTSAAWLRRWSRSPATAAVLDPAGALWLPASGMLVVADLHLEKGSSFARRGMLLPPYDTRRDAGAAGRRHRRHEPRRVVSLGDSFHDAAAPGGSPRAVRARARRADARPRLDLGRRQPRPRAAGRARRRRRRGARRRRPASSATSRRRRRAGRDRRPPASLRARSSARARRCAAAASPPTASAWSCRPSAPIPAGSTCSTAPSRRSSGAARCAPS